MSTSISFKPIREICGKIASQIPESKKGLEYHAAIGNMVNDLPEDQRKILRKSLNAFLIYMEKIEASDIDVGGHGCNGKIWYRVFGKKSPLNMEVELPIGETDVLLHNVLTQTQRDQLMDKEKSGFLLYNSD
ncbi:hypothetical protein [Rhodohalobacter sp.]|uniref:hypothetical protein n=1 Tax=Rhodohalobacter sp. TaxID=1974210 RepID=UPI002ACDC0AD|nr:hypothetical protein [Rhodohalobacter sp.]MDZ7757442.1 hypothetical protein [Rhodohalobacter sp.]